MLQYRNDQFLEKLEVLSDLSACLVQSKTAQRNCRKLLKANLVAAARFQNTGPLEDKELILCFTWLLQHVEQWSAVLLPLSHFHFIKQFYDFSTRFQHTLFVILREAQTQPLTSVLQIKQVTENSFTTLKKWLYASQEFIDKVVEHEEAELQYKLNLFFDVKFHQVQ